MADPLPTYILSLPDSPRRAIMQERIAALKMELDLHWVDGIKLDSVNQCQYRDYARVEGYHNARIALSSKYIKAVVGTKWAHMKKLSEVAERKEPWVLCMEDDVTFMLWFAEAVEKAKTAPEDIGLVTFHRAHPTDILKTPEAMGEPEIIEGKDSYIRGMVCYLIRPAFAKELLQVMDEWCQCECDMTLEYMSREQGKKYWLIAAVATGDLPSELNPMALRGFDASAMSPQEEEKKEEEEEKDNG